MLYYALSFFVVALTTVAFSLAGVAPGAAGIANLAFLLSLVFLAAKAVALRQHRPHTP